MAHVTLRITWFKNLSVAQKRCGTQDFETHHRGVSNDPENLPHYVKMPFSSTINYLSRRRKNPEIASIKFALLVMGPGQRIEISETKKK